MFPVSYEEIQFLEGFNGAHGFILVIQTLMIYVCLLVSYYPLHISVGENPHQQGHRQTDYKVCTYSKIESVKHIALHASLNLQSTKLENKN
jgi:hypothetical protein